SLISPTSAKPKLEGQKQQNGQIACPSGPGASRHCHVQYKCFNRLMNRRPILNLLIALAQTILPAPALADGLVNHGHIAGAHTTLSITPQQKASIAKTKFMILTPLQKKIMLAATGVKSVDKLYVYPRTIRTCTCELSDVAIRISPDSV